MPSSIDWSTRDAMGQLVRYNARFLGRYAKVVQADPLTLTQQRAQVERALGLGTR